MLDGKTKRTTIPILCGWEQNKDGSITGYVANRIGFRDGTLTTTSSVKTRAPGGSCRHDNWRIEIQTDVGSAATSATSNFTFEEDQ